MKCDQDLHNHITNTGHSLIVIMSYIKICERGGMENNNSKLDLQTEVELAFKAFYLFITKVSLRWCNMISLFNFNRQLPLEILK